MKVVRYSANAQKLCGKPDCPVVIGAAFLMCAPHWYAVPMSLRRKINAAFRAWQNSTAATEAETRFALRELQAEAIALVS